MNVPCPRCQKPMSVPQPLPERIKCPSCGAVISTKKKDGPPPAPSPSVPAPANPQAGSAPPPPAPPPPVSPQMGNAPPPATFEKWFYAEPGQQPAGPTTLAELTQLAAAGKIHGQTNVFRESAPQWQPAANIAELQSVLPAAGTGDEFNLTVNELPAPAANAAARSDSFLSKMHSSMPKPVLFGIYGALGGLLGALIIGELFWLLFSPAPPDIAPMKIAVAPKVTVYPGGDFNSLPVKIARQKFEGPVKFQVEKAPEFVSFSRVVIAKDESDGVFRITAGEGAQPNTYEVSLKAVAGENGEHVVTQKISLTVDPKPAILNLAAPDEVKLYVGGRNTLPFRIARDRFDGPVRLEVLDQPEGISIPFVEVAEPIQKRVGNKPSKTPDGKFSIDATKAEPGVHKLVIEAKSLKNHKITARTKFQLIVEPRPGNLRLAVSPKIVVYPGTKNTFTVRILRQDIAGIVRLEVVNAADDGALPSGVKIPAVDVPEKDNQAVLEITADENSLPDGKPVTHRLKLNAKVAIRGGDTASVTFPLTIQPPPPALQLAVSPTVSAYPGGKATFRAKIARQRFDGPVRIQMRSKNRYVTVTPVTIPAGKTDATIQLAVNTSALSLPKLPTQTLSVTADSVDKKLRVASLPQNISLEILAPPSDLSLTVSPDVELYQKGKCKFFAKITRSGFAGPVTLKFEGAPPGVTLTPTVIAANQTALELNGIATLKAEPGKYKVKITATSTKAHDEKIPKDVNEFALDLKPFDPATRPPLDVVFVLDVSKSMDPQIKGIYDGIEQFLAALKKRELEARIGMVAFRDITVGGEESLKVLDFNGQPFTDDHNVFKKEVAKLKAIGGGDIPESSLDALYKAAEQPFRNKALKVFLLVTDAPYQKIGNSIPLADAIKKLTEKKIDQVHLVVPEKFRSVYQPIQKAVKGASFDLLKVGQTPKAFTSLLSVLSEEIATAIPGKEPKKPSPPPAPPEPKELELIVSAKVPDPPAERKPASPTPVVPQAPQPGKVDVIEPESPNPPTAEAVAPPTPVQPKLQGVQSDQMFADEDRFQLLLATALWTAALAGGIALFLVSAQKRHLRHAWLSLSETGKTVGAGMLAGLLAGAVGQWFLQSTSGASWWNTITQILAWGILGGLIGAGMGYVVPNVNRQRAFIGGCIGGFAGAVGFTLVSLLAHATLGRLIGAALLGLCLGIMVALVEMASRRYWLEIIFGEREIRTANLGPTTVAVGGDEKVASIYVPDAPPKAFGFRIDRNKVYCEDFVSGRTTEAAPGDTRDVGKVKLRVCSAASAVPTGAMLQLVVARDVSLMDGMPLTVEDIPGLEPSGSDGIVALVSKRPRDPSQFLLRNRSKQSWTIIDSEGVQRMIGPGLSIELNSRCEIDFGQCKATLEPPATQTTETTEASPPPQS